MLNEPGNPNIEAFDGAVAQKHHSQFLPVEINHAGVLVSNFAGSQANGSWYTKYHATAIVRHGPKFERW